MKELLQNVAARAIQYHAGLNDRGVAPSSEAINNLIAKARGRE
jgi:hypothetical protein